MLKRFTRLIAVVVGVLMLGFVVTPSAHAGTYCVPFTQICISGYVENNSTLQFGVVGDGRDGPTTRAVLVQGKTTADLRNEGILYDADFIYSTYYRMYDAREVSPRIDRWVNPSEWLKVSGAEAVSVTTHTTRSGEEVLFVEDLN